MREKEKYCFLIVVVVTMAVATVISVMTHKNKTKKSLHKYGRERRGKKYFTVISVRDELL